MCDEIAGRNKSWKKITLFHELTYLNIEQNFNASLMAKRTR